MTKTPTRKPQGFAAMTHEQHQSIARKGGEAVVPQKRTFTLDPALASRAGKKGGAGTAPEKRVFSKDRDLAREAGKKGGSNLPKEKRSFFLNPELARQASLKGVAARRAKKAEQSKA